MRTALAAFTFVFLVGCSTGGIGTQSEPELEQVIQITATPKVVLVIATEMPTPGVEIPTPTPRPEYCYSDPSLYLDEIERIYSETMDTIDYWNHSRRDKEELLEVEIRIRDLIEQVDALDPPEDFEKVQAHFSRAMELNLSAIFGITDQIDDHREGSNVSFQKEFQLAWEAWDAAYGNRLRVCE